MSAAIILAGSSAIALAVVPFLSSARKSVRITAWILGVAAFVAILALCAWHAFGNAGALGSILGAATERWRALTEFEKGVFSTLAAVFLAGSALVGLVAALKGRQLAPVAPERPENTSVTPVTVERSDTAQTTTSIAAPEIPDSEVVPALLDRLPGDQWQLLLSLELGEKVLTLNEPGLEDLERNRLAQRLLQVKGNDYFFRLHPSNADFVHAKFKKNHSSDTARESALALALVDSYCDKVFNNLETMQRLRGLYAVCAAAEGYAREYLVHEIALHEPSVRDTGRDIIYVLVDRYLRPTLEKGRANVIPSASPRAWYLALPSALGRVRRASRVAILPDGKTIVASDNRSSLHFLCLDNGGN